VLFGAWQGERFAREERLKPFKHYRKELSQRGPRGAVAAQSPAERLLVFRAIAASGVGLKIERVSTQ
jgi:hypothetical protein